MRTKTAVIPLEAAGCSGSPEINITTLDLSVPSARACRIRLSGKKLRQMCSQLCLLLHLQRAVVILETMFRRSCTWRIFLEVHVNFGVDLTARWCCGGFKKDYTPLTKHCYLLLY